MYIVGLTGGIASGKTTVMDMLKNLRCNVIDAEEIANQILKPGGAGWKKIKKYFGPEAFLDNGELNRRYIANLTFSKPEKNQLFIMLIQPLIRSHIMWKVVRLFICGHQFVIINIPLLYESKMMMSYMKYTIVVNCTENQQVERLLKLGEITEMEAMSRIKIQMNLFNKSDLATFIVDNSSSREYTQEQVERIVRLLRASKAQWKSRSIFFLGFVSLSVAAAAVYYTKFK
ncbi:dephosphodomain-containingCoA kinase domain-containing [Octopus vulgaris]|uniref:Dephosphodomain-containingCoA kinase domain-containing n=1 Tax=Octopus vulgaris TaxID=6645 RepID=A0AA36BKI7_OCTVU|nr:dephosphodomain-containingCoA kinase domain-containing [Octopus vulgaris]